ncbi:MAG: WhiB family transcriptional regulator [Nitriliruptorales bacterium]
MSALDLHVRLNAACAGHHPRLWQPDEAVDDEERCEMEAEAKATCASCVVRDECLEEALVNREEYGIWGGLTPGERLRLYPRVPGENWYEQALAGV